MDFAARVLILDTLGLSYSDAFAAFVRERYLSVDDYLAAVTHVWGADTRASIRSEISKVANEVPTVTSVGHQMQAENLFARTVLGYMPEPDFRSAVLLASREGSALPRRQIAEAINRICRNRRIEWEYVNDEGFRWVGDEEVERRAMHPVLSAVGDLRFAGATQSEFEQARIELGMGTPPALKQCVTESSNAVESAMKVLLTEHKVNFGEGDTAFKLFEQLERAGIVPRFMERIVLGPAVARNKSGGHGAGVLPHDVPQEMAEATLASTAAAIAYLHKLLP